MTNKSKKVHYLRVKIDSDLHRRLKAVCTHRGELSYLIRQGIDAVVTRREQFMVRLNGGIE